MQHCIETKMPQGIPWIFFLWQHTAQHPKWWPFQCITWSDPVWCKGNQWICEQSSGSWRTCPADGLKTRSPPHRRPCHSLPVLAPATVNYEAHTPHHLGQEQETSAESKYSTLCYSPVKLGSISHIMLITGLPSQVNELAQGKICGGGEESEGRDSNNGK